ncbi:MAG: hypothetical protein ABIT96_11625 [Ferruginibacter sp.]
MKPLITIFICLTCLSCYQSNPQPASLPGNNGLEIKGVSLVAPREPAGDSIFAPLENIHSNYVSLMPYAFSRPGAGIVIYNDSGKWWGESVAGVEACIKMAHNKKFKVMLKPHLWLSHGEYTGHFSLPNHSAWQAWEKTFSLYILRFAKIADSMQVDIFCFATEMEKAIVQRPAYWTELIKQIRKIYSGKLTYAANWDEYTKIPFWKELDYIGVDAYFPLSGKETPGVADVEKGWENHKVAMAALSRELNKKILFTEYGYQNTDSNCAEPWKELNAHRNDIAQANAYEGFFNSFSNETWFAGGFIWKWHSQFSTHFLRSDYMPQPLALEVISKGYGR